VSASAQKQKTANLKMIVFGRCMSYLFIYFILFIVSSYVKKMKKKYKMANSRDFRLDLDDVFPRAISVFLCTVITGSMRMSFVV